MFFDTAGKAEKKAAVAVAVAEQAKAASRVKKEI